MGLYLNKAPNTLVHNNILMGTAGVDVRYEESYVTLHNNIVDGRIISRDGGVFDAANNIMSWWKAMLLRPVTNSIYRNVEQADFSPIQPHQLRDMGTAVQRPYTDFCGDLASMTNPDIGAFQIQSSRACNDLREGHE